MKTGGYDALRKWQHTMPVKARAISASGNEARQAAGVYPSKGDQIMRYRVRPIADAKRDSLKDEVLGEFNSLPGAEYCAENCDHRYGAGIEDTETGLIDFGSGFVKIDGKFGNIA